MRITLPKDCLNLVCELFPMPQSMKIQDAKAAVDKQREKLKNLPAFRESEVQSKQEVIEQPHKKRQNSSLCNAHWIVPRQKL